MNDYIIIHTENFGPQQFTLEELELEWPPPERLALGLEGIREVRDTDSSVFILKQAFLFQGENSRSATYKYQDLTDQDNEMFGPNHIEHMHQMSPEREEVFNKLAQLAKLQEPSTLTLKKED